VDLAGDGAFLVKGRNYFASGYMFLCEGDQLCFYAATEHTPGVAAAGRAYEAVKSGPVLVAGRWQHVAAVYSTSGARAALYHNGRKVFQVRADGRIVYQEPKLPLNLGAMSYPGYWNLHGFLRDVRLYSTALSDERIQTLYNEGRPAVATLAVTTKEERTARAYPARIRVSVVDRQTGRPRAAKLMVKDATGQCHWPADAFAYGLGGREQCFYTSGDFELPAPAGKLEISATSGFEYRPLTMSVEATPTITPLRLTLERLVDMPAHGWYAGEHHLHPVGHTRRRYDPRMTLENAAAICKAEGLDFAFWMGPRGHDINSTDELPNPWIVGDSQPGWLFATDGFVAQCCIEPIGVCGHRCVIGTPHWTVRGNPQFQAMSIFDQVRRAGGLCIFSHPYAGGLPLEKDSGLCFARELPVAVALGRAELWDLLCGGGSLEEKCRDWYRWLNLGFRLAIGGSSDCYMNDPAVIITPGHNRTYVKAASLAIPDLLEAYRQGRTVATNGPLLTLTVDGRQLGATIVLPGDKPRRLRARVEAHHADGIARVELIQNGTVVRTLDADAETELEIGHTCCLAARATGTSGKQFGTFAHTSPIYVQFGDEPMKPNPADVRFFLDWLEGYRQALAEYGRKNGIPQEDYAALLGHIEHAARVYQGLPAAPRCWTRQP
jgi:hypothetical protein